MLSIFPSDDITLLPHYCYFIIYNEQQSVMSCIIINCHHHLLLSNYSCIPHKLWCFLLQTNVKLPKVKYFIISAISITSSILIKPSHIHPTFPVLFTKSQINHRICFWLLLFSSSRSCQNSDFARKHHIGKSPNKSWT
jgi:hypothetical protein